jgi:hypothetical protein
MPLNMTSEILSECDFSPSSGVWQQEEKMTVGNRSQSMAESAYYARLSHDINLNGTGFDQEAAAQV